MYVCICAGTTEDQVHLCITAGARTTKQVAMGCGAGRGRGCGTCHSRIRSMIEDHYSDCESEQISEVEQISA
ncbi:(2Fe-2S)-binding protein [Rhodococcus kronopolitis]|uniref:Bacterioferritin-associated ferredoxin n=1 Tax=Rhodococcus kronopolitis TaxID=1460226 RepID=A0ABV9FUU9_9NOCA